MKRKKWNKLIVLAVCLSLFMLLLAGCKQKKENQDTVKVNTNSMETSTENTTSGNSGSTDSTITQKYKAGTYKAEAQGKDGLIKVEVTFSETEITDIKILSQTETEGLGDDALNAIKGKVLEGQTLAVDAVSGATESSNGLLAAIEDAVKQANGDVDALKSNKVTKENEGKVEKMNADVVVIGAGASGVSAAVTAADKGAKVIIIEKTAVIGGASNLSWAGKFYNSSAALENGVKVEVEKEIANWIVNNHWRVDAAAIRQYVTKSGETYEWLADKGYQTTFMNFGGEQLHLLPPYEDRQKLLKNMLSESVVKGGGEVLTETTGKKLLTNDSGDVVGVSAEKADGTTLEITAKSVVMATGPGIPIIIQRKYSIPFAQSSR